MVRRDRDPPRDCASTQNRIDGGALAAHWQCDGGVAADEAAGGAMADGRLRGGTAVVLTVVKLLDLLTSSGSNQTWHLGFLKKVVLTRHGTWVS